MVLIPKFSKRMRVKNFGLVVVTIQVNPSDTTIMFLSGDASKLPTTFPFRLVHVDSEEVVEVTSLVSGSEYNVTRAVEGGSAGTILTDEKMLLSLTAFMWEHATERLNRLERMYIRRFEIENGTYFDGTTDDWKVTEQDPQAMAVDVTAGFGAISGEPVETAAGSITVVAPGSNKYIGLIQYTLGVGLNVKYGATHPTVPSTPSLDSDSLSLAEILIDTGDTVIDNSQITSTLEALYF